MQRTKLQFARLMELDRLIREGKYPNALSFSQEREVSQKTVQRDIEYLRDYHGAPLEYDRFKKGYYYKDKNWFLPAFNMSENELRALLLAKVAVGAFKDTGVGRDLDRITDKLLETLSHRLPFQPEVLFSRFSFVHPPAKVVNSAIWSIIANGLLSQRSVEIRYHSLNSGETSDRIIDPYHIANLQGEWYVIAWCHRAKELRQFGIPQIQQTELTAATFEMPDDFDPEKLFGDVFGRFVLGEKAQKVRLRFEKAVAWRVMTHPWHAKQKIKKLPGGDIELSFRSVGLYEISRWVLGWGHSVKVLEPASLKKMVRDEIRLMARKN